MRIIAKSTIEKAKEYFNNPHLSEQIDLWLAYVKRETYRNPHEVKQHYRNASIITSKRVVFNIKGNDYRLIVDIEYRLGILFIVDIMTHPEYDKTNVASHKHTDSRFYQQ